MDNDALYMPAPEGLTWVCGACGKTSRTKSGVNKDGTNASSYGWDESCFLNAVLCKPAATGSKYQWEAANG